MDVSGSMGSAQKDIVRVESFWIDTWLRRNYDGLESRYIIHDSQAKEVDRYTFFHTNESGGTIISSAYKLLSEIIEKEGMDDSNLYTFQFSDGDNQSGDNELCIDLLEKKILHKMNLFGYGQVTSPYGSGKFIEPMSQLTEIYTNVITSEIADKSKIIQSIKDFFNPEK